MVQPYRVAVLFRGVWYSILNPRYVYAPYNRSLNRVILPPR